MQRSDFDSFEKVKQTCKYLRQFYVEKKRMFGFLSKKIMVITEYGITIYDFPDYKFFEHYAYLDIVKVIKSSTIKNGFDLTCKKKSTNDAYQYVGNIQFLEGSYMKGVDLFQEDRNPTPVSMGPYDKQLNNDDAQSNGSQDTIVVETSLCVNNADGKKYHPIFLNIYKSFIRIVRIGNYDEEDILNQRNPTNPTEYDLYDLVVKQIDIDYIDISNLINEGYGFRIIMKESSAIYTIHMLNITSKSLQIDKIIQNAKEYLGIVIENPIKKGENLWWVGEKFEVHQNHSKDKNFERTETRQKIDSRINFEINSTFSRTYKGFCLTKFNQIHKIEVMMNETFLYEIVDGHINNRLSQNYINQVILKHKFLPIVAIHFDDGYYNTYLLGENDIECFVTHLKQIIDFAPAKFFVPESTREENEKAGLHNRTDFSSFIKLKLIQSRFFECNKKIHGLLKIDSVKDFEKNLLDEIKRCNDYVIYHDLFTTMLYNCPFKNDLEPKNTLYNLANYVNEYAERFKEQGNQYDMIKSFESEQTRHYNRIESALGLLQQDCGRKESLPYTLFEILSFTNKDKSVSFDSNKNKGKGGGTGTILDNTLRISKYAFLQKPKESVKKDLQLFELVINFISVSMNNKSFFQEFTMQIHTGEPQVVAHYKKFFVSLYTVYRQNANRIMKYLCGNQFLILLKYPGFSNQLDKRTESLNKNIVINSKYKINFIQDFVKDMSNICLKCPQDQLSTNLVKSDFCISISLDIIESLIVDRKYTTTSEDIAEILKWINNTLSFQILSQISRSTSLYATYKASLTINAIIKSLELSKDEIKAYQILLLHNSTLLLRHIELLMSPVSKNQKKQSLVLIYHCLIDNIDAVALLRRLIPKSLFRHVNTSTTDITKWAIIQWEELFIQLENDYDTPTEQWNLESRKELRVKLLESQEDFYIRWKPLEDSHLSSIIVEIEMAGNLSKSKELALKVLQLRWNYEEFEINYAILEQKLPVGDYYIEELFEEKQNPELKIEIINPSRLFDELIVKLIASGNFYVKVKVLQTLTLLYKNYYEKIKELTFMPYLIKLLQSYAYPEFKYLVLQQLYLSLSVPNTQLASANMRKFEEFGGQQNLRDYLLFCVTLDDPEIIDMISQENFQSKMVMPLFLKNQYQKDLKLQRKRTSDIILGKNEELLIYDYTWANLETVRNINDLCNNSLVLGVKIIQECLKKSRQSNEDLLLYPHPYARKMIIENETVNLMQLLQLSPNESVLQAAHELIQMAYLHKYAFSFLLENTNFQELCFLRLKSNSATIAISNIKTLFKKWESSLKLEKRANLDSFINSINELQDDEITNNLRLNQVAYFPALGFLPKYMIKLLIDKPETMFKDIYFSEGNFERGLDTPDFIWKESMRKSLVQHLEGLFEKNVKKMKKKIIELHDNSKVKIGHVDWNEFSFEKISTGTQLNYKELEKELIVGPIFIKNWIKSEFASYNLQDTIVKDFIISLNEMLRAVIRKIVVIDSLYSKDLKIQQLEDLLVILNCHLKILKVYEISNYDCYDSMEIILETWINQYVGTNKNFLEESSFFNLQQLDDQAIRINLLDQVVIRSLDILIESIGKGLESNVRTLAYKSGTRNSLLKIASIIVEKYCDSQLITWNHLKIFKKFFVVCSEFNTGNQLKIIKPTLLEIFRIEKNLVGTPKNYPGIFKDHPILPSSTEDYCKVIENKILRNVYHETLTLEQVISLGLQMYADYYYSQETSGFEKLLKKDNNVKNETKVEAIEIPHTPSKKGSFDKSIVSNKDGINDKMNIDTNLLSKSNKIWLERSPGLPNNFTSPSKYLDIDQITLVSSLWNIHELVTQPKPLNEVVLEIEKDFLLIIELILTITNDISEQVFNQPNYIKSGLIHRCFELSGFGISGAIKQDESVNEITTLIEKNSKKALRIFRYLIIRVFISMLKIDKTISKRYLSNLDEEQIKQLLDQKDTLNETDANIIKDTFFILTNLYGPKYLSILVESFCTSSFETSIDQIYSGLIEGKTSNEYKMNKEIMRNIRQLLTKQFILIYQTKGEDYCSLLHGIGLHEVANEPVIKGLYLSSYVLTPTKVEDTQTFFEDLKRYYKLVEIFDYRRVYILLQFLPIFLEKHPDALMPYDLTGFQIKVFKNDDSSFEFKSKILEVFIICFSYNSEYFSNEFMQGRFIDFIIYIQEKILGKQDQENHNSKISDETEQFYLKQLLLITKQISTQSKVIKALVDSGSIIPFFSIVMDSKVNIELRTKVFEIILLVHQSKRGSCLEFQYEFIEIQARDSVNMKEFYESEHMDSEACSKIVLAQDKEKISPFICYNLTYKVFLACKLKQEFEKVKSFTKKHSSDYLTYDYAQRGNIRDSNTDIKFIEITNKYSYDLDIQNTFNIIKNEFVLEANQQRIGLKMWLNYFKVIDINKDIAQIKLLGPLLSKIMNVQLSFKYLSYENLHENEYELIQQKEQSIGQKTSVLVHFLEIIYHNQTLVNTIPEDMSYNLINVVKNSFENLIHFLNTMNLLENTNNVSLSPEVTKVYYSKLENALLSAQALQFNTFQEKKITHDLITNQFKTNIETILTRKLVFDSDNKEFLISGQQIKVLALSVYNYNWLFNLENYDSFTNKMAIILKNKTNEDTANCYTIGQREFMSVLLGYGLLNKMQTDFLKKNLELLYMDIISIKLSDSIKYYIRQASDISEFYMESKIEHWLTADLTDMKHLIFPVIPKRYFKVKFK